MLYKYMATHIEQLGQWGNYIKLQSSVYIMYDDENLLYFIKSFYAQVKFII